MVVGLMDLTLIHSGKLLTAHLDGLWTSIELLCIPEPNAISAVSKLNLSGMSISSKSVQENEATVNTAMRRE